MKLSVCAVIALSVVPLLSPLALADVATILPTCNACHGPDGISQLPEVPTIAGMSALSLEVALDEYRAGDRVCPTVPYPSADPSRPRMDMCVHANGLAEENIAGVAEHYAALPFVPAVQQTDAAKAAEGKAIHDRDCEICHSQGGSNPADDASLLAGQHMEYLRLTFADYASGARSQPRAMEAKVAALSPAEIDALIHFYGSQQ